MRFEALLVEADDDLVIDLGDRRRHVAELRQLVQCLLVPRNIALDVRDALP